MRKTLRALLIGALISFGQTAFATPQEDAAYIAERYFEGQLTDMTRTFFKKTVARSYERELSARNFKIVNTERFLDMIPDSEVDPFLEELRLSIVEQYAQSIDPAYLAEVAATLRMFADVPANEVMIKRHEAAYAQSYAKSHKEPRSSDPVLASIEEMTAQLNTLNTMMDGPSGPDIANDIAMGMAPIMTMVSMGLEIAAIERRFATQFMIDIVAADGIVKGANPTMRRGLIAELEAALAQEVPVEDETAPSASTDVQSLFVSAPSKP